MRRLSAVLLMAGTVLLAGGVVLTRVTWSPSFVAASTQEVPGADCRLLQHRGKKTDASACFTKLAQSKDSWSRAEALYGSGQWEEANDAFRAAVAAQPKNPAVRVRWARLFLERFNPPEAQKLFKEALELKPDSGDAYLGLALVAAESYSSSALESAQMALKCNPQLVEAQELLARLALEDANPTKAREEANKAVAQSGEAFKALAVLAAADLLEDKTADVWFAKIDKVNPSYGAAHQLVGHFFVLNRRYDEGIAMFREALKRDPDLHGARAELGINLMRLGQEKEAREQLETTYNANYKSDATV
ncbi:MAG: tetratricopeptide repeat protein, partial [Bryobacteraceae bacterium]|nr:tetratricopeptide repeat protein [Bryobacteraceae bacterium]